MRSPLIVAAILLGCLNPLLAEAPTSGKLKVAALHPLMADLARQVGGQRVSVYDLMGDGSNPHRFEPRPEDMEQMRRASLILAAGMGLESYLGRIRDTLGAEKLLEVGATLPALEVCGSHQCAGHDHQGHADPHWWHGIDQMSRATRVLAEALAKQDPDGAAIYQQNAGNYRRQLDKLKRWAKLELAEISPQRRKLITAHHAFGYFADEFDFEVIAISGLNAEQETGPQRLAELIRQVREAPIAVIFPEQFTNSKVLRSVADEAGCRLATPLIADGNGKGSSAGFEGMIRHNVTAITKALATP